MKKKDAAVAQKTRKKRAAKGATRAHHNQKKACTFIQVDGNTLVRLFVYMRNIKQQHLRALAKPHARGVEALHFVSYGMRHRSTTAVLLLSNSLRQ